MSQLEWNEETLPSLTRKFLRNVHEKMRHDDSTVRFGLTGNGSNPNYEVEFPNGRKLAYSGLSHEQDTRTDKFDGSNLSNEFSRQQIAEARAKAPR